MGHTGIARECFAQRGNRTRSPHFKRELSGGSTTMNPDNRVIVQITIEDAEKADEAFTILMGDQVDEAGQEPDSYAGDALVRWFLFRGSGLLDKVFRKAFANIIPLQR